MCYDVTEEKQLADCQQAEIEQLQRKVSELQGELKSEMKHSRAVDSDAHVRTSVTVLSSWDMDIPPWIYSPPDISPSETTTRTYSAYFLTDLGHFLPTAIEAVGEPDRHRQHGFANQFTEPLKQIADTSRKIGAWDHQWHHGVVIILNLILSSEEGVRWRRNVNFKLKRLEIVLNYL